MTKQPEPILIVEDDPLIAEDIAQCLQEAGHTIAGMAASADAAMKLLKKKPVSLVLLDIQLEGSIDGIMLSGLIREQGDVPIIFLTSFNDPATLDKVKAAKARGYLTKPFDDAELITNVGLALGGNEPKATEENDHPESNMVFVRHNGSLVKLDLEEILYAEASDNYCFIHTKKTKYLLSQTLKAIEEKLDKHRFMRVHRSFLVRLKAIEVMYDDYLVINGNNITISRACKQELMSRISLL